MIHQRGLYVYSPSDCPDIVCMPGSKIWILQIKITQKFISSICGFIHTLIEGYIEIMLVPQFLDVTRILQWQMKHY